MNEAIVGLNAETQKMGTGTATGTAPKTETKTPEPVQTPEPPKPSGDPSYDKFLQTQQDFITDLTSGYTEFQKQSEAIRANLNIASQSLIDGIKSSFERSVEATKKVNDATLAGLTQAGIRAGRSRYTIETEDTGLANEMREGIRRISDLEAKKNSLIAEAQVAQTKQDWEMLYKNYSESQRVAAELNQAVVEMYKTRQENEKLAQQAVQQKVTNMKTIQDVSLKTVDSIGYLAMNLLTGDKAQDAETLQALAAQYEVDPNQILSKVQELQATSAPKYTGTVGEYQFYADQLRKSGGTPVDFTTWQKQQAMLSKVPETRTTSTVDEYGNVSTSTSTTSFGGGSGGGGVPPTRQQVVPGSPTSTTAPSSSVNPAMSGKDPRAQAISIALNALGPQLTKDQRGSTMKTINDYLAKGDIENAKNTLLSIAVGSLPATEQTKAFGRNHAIRELDPTVLR